MSTENQNKQCRGVVTDIGPKVNGINIGDYVIFPDYAGTIVYTDGEEYLIMRDAEVLAVLG